MHTELDLASKVCAYYNRVPYLHFAAQQEFINSSIFTLCKFQVNFLLLLVEFSSLDHYPKVSINVNPNAMFFYNFAVLEFSLDTQSTSVELYFIICGKGHVMMRALIISLPGKTNNLCNQNALGQKWRFCKYYTLKRLTCCHGFLLGSLTLSTDILHPITRNVQHRKELL